jgi:hypothetical protein
MRGDMVAMLKYEATIKKDVQRAIDQIDTLSHEDIDRLTMPLPWYLVALHRMKTEREALDQTAMILSNTKDLINPDPIGWMAEWHHDNTYIQVTTAMSIEIKTGTLVFFPEEGGVWIETTYCKQIDPRMANLPPIKLVAKTEYSKIYRERINKRAT